MINDLFKDDDGAFMGTPQSKFFDIVYNGNRDMAEAEIDALLDRLAAFEVLFGEHEGIEEKITSVKFEQIDAFKNAKHDIYITSMGNIVTNE